MPIYESYLICIFILLLVSPFIYDPHGRLYTGTMNSTESGKPCQPWSTSIFKQFFNYTGSQFADKFIPGAVCRNLYIPSKNKTSPWCFTNIHTLNEEKCSLSEGGNVRCKSFFTIFLVLIWTLLRLFGSVNLAKNVR